MERVGEGASPFNVGALQFVENLIEQDGPLLSLYRGARGDYYLLCWLDCDETTNRWMALRTDAASLMRYLGREETLRDVVSGAADGFVWIVDFDSGGAQVGARSVPLRRLPQDYIPAADSWFEFGRREELLAMLGADVFEVDVPQSDRAMFAALMSRMGWRVRPSASPRGRAPLHQDGLPRR